MNLVTIKKETSRALRSRLAALVVLAVISSAFNLVYYDTSQSHAATGVENESPFRKVTFLATSVTQSEYDALVAFYNSTDGDNWIENTNWLSNEPIDTWYGITIKNNKVTRLELPNNNLSGSIPIEFTDLSNLVRVNLSGNYLAGSIPPELGQLENLERIYLSHNDFTGTIPPELGNLTQLEVLYLDNNNLEGSLPPELGLLVNLEELDLGNNNLSGTVPQELGTIESLEALHVNHNRFDKFPDISNLENLDRLRIDNNLLTFESIEPNIGVPKNTFEYSPQDSVGEARVENLVTGSPLTLQIEVGGEHNVYQWFKDGEEITDAVSDIFIIAAILPQDAGEYELRITNTVATDLTLYGRPVTVNVIHSDPPVVPVLVSPVHNASGISLTPVLEWEESERAESYTVRVSENSDMSDPLVDQSSLTDSSYGIGALTYDTRYYWYVRAENAAGVSAWSDMWSFTTKQAIPDVPMLVSPENEATDISTDATLHWDDSNRAESYRLQVSTESDFSSAMIDASGLEGTSYGLTDLESSTTYYWRVRAENGGGSSVWSDPWCFTILEVTSVAGYGHEIPAEFVLNQNYPNPFNPSTMIRYGLAERSYVTVVVYNTLGKLVARLVEDEQEKGFYEVTFDASQLPSGVYIYRLQAGEYVESKKLLFLK